MPKSGRGRGSSSAASKHSRSSSAGRVQKNGKQTITNPAAITIAGEAFNPDLLHPGYKPPAIPRSPVKTRGRTALGLAGSSQVNQSGSSGNKSTGGIPISNPYESLNGGDDDDDDDTSSDDDDNESQRKKEKQKTRPKERRPPPIHCLGHLADDVDELLEGLQYCLKLGKTSIQVFTHDKKNFVDVLKTLKQNGIKHYTFSHAEDTPVKIVLVGYQDRPISDLEEHLHGVKVRPREVKILSRKTTETATHTLYLLYFDRGTVKIQDLRRIKALDGFWVSWRSYAKHPTDAAQCHRCQKYGHGSRHCNLQPRCVKCGETHLTEVCSLPRKANLGENAQQLKARIKCANCGGNHTGNYRGCAARKTYLEEQARKKKTAAPRSQRNTSATVPAAGQRTVPADNATFPPGWGRSFASVVASGSGNAAQQEVTGEDLFTLPEFFALAGVMMTRFRTCRNKAEQFMALGELMIKYIYNR